MTPLPATRKSTISARTDTLDQLKSFCAADYGTDLPKGLGHLLENITLEEVLGQPELDHLQVEMFRRVLVDGRFPHGQNVSEAAQFLTCWLVQNKQGKLLRQWLDTTPLFLLVSTKDTAAGLLAIMQSTLSFSGLTLQLATHFRNDLADEVIPLLGQAFQANASLTKITLFQDGHGPTDLSTLLDVLAGVVGLELAIEGNAIAPGDLECLGKLLSTNKTLRLLALHGLRSVPDDDCSEAAWDASVAGAIKHIAGQLQLECLELSNVPPHCQRFIGELMCTSHLLKELQIALDGTMVDPALIHGFRQTSSVDSVVLSVGGLEDGMLSLVSSIADANTSITSLELRSSFSRVDRNDSTGLCRLISNNGHLASLIWRMPAGCNVDLAQLGMALKKNNRLETLMLIESVDVTEQAESDDEYPPGWINETSISALVMNLKKNCTLTELVLASEVELRSPVKKNYSVIQQVLDRNRAFQRYGCSDDFLFGAVEGFFATIDLPVDTAMGTAQALMHYKPRTGVAALALVNKASYANAVFRRREAQSTMLDHLLPLTGGLVINRRQQMIHLLNGMIVSKGDFSRDSMLRMADSESLPGALVEIMFRSPHDYLYLVQAFCQAVGVPKIRSCVISQIARDVVLGVNEAAETEMVFLLSMLEQSFPPDQKHLVPFVEKELNYDAINSAAVKLFVGYDIPKVSGLGSYKPALVSWCMENRHPGVLIAFYDARGSKVVIDFTACPGAFARSMMEKIGQLNKARILSIQGIPDYEDAVVLHRVLAGTSRLKELHIDGNCCGQEFEFIMQGLRLNTRITSLFVNLREMPDPPAIGETLAGLLDANRKIKCISLQLHDDDPEQPQLRQLAAMDDRLELEHVGSTDDSD
jgi:hypothetical protein